MTQQFQTLDALKTSRTSLQGQQLNLILKSEQDTAQFAGDLSKLLIPGDVIYLKGELGAGKTFLSQRLIHALGYHDKVLSPTYSLVQTYSVNHPTGSGLQAQQISVKLPLHHFDLYRLADPEELEFIGIRDYFCQESICLIEWPSKGLGILPKPTIELCLQYHPKNPESRTVNIQYL